MRIIRHAIGAREILCGIEDNKPEALAAMREAAAPFGEMSECNERIRCEIYRSDMLRNVFVDCTFTFGHSERAPANIGVEAARRHV